MSQCWPCAAGRHCGNCTSCCKAKPGRSPMASGEEKGCVLWTLMSIGLIVAVLVVLCA
jgi:hypothetical protein